MKIVSAFNAHICRQLDRIVTRLRRLDSSLSPQLQREILGLLRFLEPEKVNGHVKIRVGTNGDGGYVQLDDLAGISRAFSFGIGNNDDWDVAMAQAGVPVEQFDHSVERAPSNHPLLHFHRKMISAHAGVETITVSDLVAAHSKLAAPDLILKIDIENGEWDVFDNTPDAVLAKFVQIVCEFHNLSHLTDSIFRERAHRVFEKLAKYFAPIHVHGNNCCRLVNICNITLPDFLEITFASRNRYSFAENSETFPTLLDAPNCPRLPEIILGTFRFSSS
jgi:hypothetical protein